jgi:formate dehydrogenase assembly factor FdhD
LETVLKRELIHFDNLSKKSTKQNLLGEEPLSIRVEGKPYAVVMRTPGDEMAHVAGFCLTEGDVEKYLRYWIGGALSVRPAAAFAAKNWLKIFTRS